VTRRARLIFHVVLSVLDSSRTGVTIIGENRSSYILQQIPVAALSKARLLVLRVRNPPGARMSALLTLCLLSGSGLCDGSIHRPEESYRACVCARVRVSLSVIRCNNFPLRQQQVGIKRRT
jgi:hypothetical protein